MPSSISPTLAKMPIAVMLTQPDICAMRVASSAAVAMSPADAGAAGPEAAARRRSGAPAACRPASSARSGRSRWWRRSGWWRRDSPRAPRASPASSCMPWLKSLTVAMLVRASTTWPVTTARAAARALDADADPRHVVADQHDVAGEPDDHPQRQPEVDPAHHRDRADDRGHREAEGVDRLGDRLGDRPRRLLLLLGDAAGEVVVEEAQRLPERVAVQPRQHQRIEVGAERQRVQRRAEPHQHRGAAAGRTPRRRGARASCSARRPSGPARLREVDQPADDRGRGHLGRADRDRDGERERDRREGAARAPSP